MILREWRAEIRRSERDAYVAYVRATGLAGYAGTPGNLGSAIAVRDLDAERSEIVTFSYWSSMEAIAAFAGEPVDRARYYPEDDKYLLTRPDKVAHYDMLGNPAPGPSHRTDEGSSGVAECSTIGHHEPTTTSANTAMNDCHPAAVPGSGIAIYDRAQTAALLDFAELVDAVAVAAAELDAGAIRSPERMVVPLGAGAVMLSMPAAAPDIAIHKLVNVHPDNKRRGLPAIHGAVTVCDTTTGQVRCVLDGPEVTGRRTAAVSLLAIRQLLPRAPQHILLIGTGVQARYHVQALHALYPQAQVWVQARTSDGAARFCDAHGDLHWRLQPRGDAAPAMDVVITLTTSTEPVYDDAPRAGCLVIGVGAFRPEMAELGATTLHGSDLYADDPAGARHEAGDLLRAGVDWPRVASLGALLRGALDPARPAVFKSVGTAAWDLAAARVALRRAGLVEAASGNDSHPLAE